MKATAQKAAPAPQDPLDALVEGDPKDVIALLLWKNRHGNPELCAQITEADIKGFKDCCEYQEIEPEVRIYRPAGRPATEAIPATGTRPAVAARPADPPKPYVLAALMVKGKQDSFRPVENNQEDFDRAKDAEKIRLAVNQAQRHADNVIRCATSGESSLSEMQDAANALLLMARALQR